jgi:hypothetical protein
VVIVNAGLSNRHLGDLQGEVRAFESALAPYAKLSALVRSKECVKVSLVYSDDVSAKANS